VRWLRVFAKINKVDFIFFILSCRLTRVYFLYFRLHQQQRTGATRWNADLRIGITGFPARLPFVPVELP
jgi:hypothetical protein